MCFKTAVSETRRQDARATTCASVFATIYNWFGNISGTSVIVNNQMRRPQIAIFPAEQMLRPNRLLEALSELYWVDFVEWADGKKQLYDAAFLFGVSREKAVEAASSGLRCLAFIGGQTVPVASASQAVCLSASSCLPQCFRGRTLPDKAIERVCPLKPEAGDEVLARKGDDILWLHRKKGVSGIDLVAMEPPALADGGYLFEHFQSGNWLRLLPLLHFLREVSGWEYPPLRAGFMFDDPNLHWKSYGYVNYDRLVQDAGRHNYHASFATVPMDGWHVHRGTVSLFQKNQNRLSLLIHGNNHTPKELARTQDDTSRLALAAQALQRIERLERASGLKISRVMAAPHGACSHDMATVLLRTGFEAACISRGSIMNQNPGTAWTVSVGLNPAEFLGAGLPVIPRFRLRRGCETEMILAAFLGQPVIPVGHHEEVAGGLDLLAVLAGALNSTGEVEWMDMKSIARSNFCTRREGGVLHVKMYSRKILLKVPQGVNQLCIHRPWLKDGAAEAVTLRTATGDLALYPSYTGESIAIISCEEMEVHAIPADAIDPRTVSLSRTPLWAVARRQLCETRDRLKPLSDKLFGKKKQPR